MVQSFGDFRYASGQTLVIFSQPFKQLTKKAKNVKLYV